MAVPPLSMVPVATLAEPGGAALLPAVATRPFLAMVVRRLSEEPRGSAAVMRRPCCRIGRWPWTRTSREAAGLGAASPGLAWRASSTTLPGGSTPRWPHAGTVTHRTRNGPDRQPIALAVHLVCSEWSLGCW